VSPDKLEPFAFSVNGAFAPLVPAITFDLGVSRMKGVPPGVVTFALAFVIAAAATVASSEGGGVEVCDIVASQGESWI
jgi:hypothetical protein